MFAPAPSFLFALNLMPASTAGLAVRASIITKTTTITG
jgi:hypothetical protein